MCMRLKKDNLKQEKRNAYIRLHSWMYNFGAGGIIFCNETFLSFIFFEVFAKKKKHFSAS